MEALKKRGLSKASATLGLSLANEDIGKLDSLLFCPLDPPSLPGLPSPASVRECAPSVDRKRFDLREEGVKQGNPFWLSGAVDVKSGQPFGGVLCAVTKLRGVWQSSFTTNTTFYIR